MSRSWRKWALAGMLGVLGAWTFDARPACAQTNTYADVPFNQGSLFYRPSGARPPATMATPTTAAAPVYNYAPQQPTYTYTPQQQPTYTYTPQQQPAYRPQQQQTYTSYTYMPQRGTMYYNPTNGTYYYPQYRQRRGLFGGLFRRNVQP